MLNWIVWNRTVYIIKIDLGLDNLEWLTCYKTKLNQTKSSKTKVKEPGLPYYLPVTGWVFVGFIPFPRVLVPCEMPTASPMIELGLQGPFPMKNTVTPDYFQPHEFIDSPPLLP